MSSGVRYHRQREPNERLMAWECAECGWVAFPEHKRVCKRCGAAPADMAEVRLAEEGIVRTFVVQERLPAEFETPLPLAIVDVPQADGEGDPARVYGLLTETTLEDLEVGTRVEARFREVFTIGERPVHSFKFSVPRVPSGDSEPDGPGGEDA